MAFFPLFIDITRSKHENACRFLWPLVLNLVFDNFIVKFCHPKCWRIGIIDHLVKVKNWTLLVFYIKASKILYCDDILFQRLAAKANLRSCHWWYAYHIIGVIHCAKYLKIYFLWCIACWLGCSDFALRSGAWSPWAWPPHIAVAHLRNRAPWVYWGWSAHVWANGSIHAILVISSNEVEVRLPKGTVHVSFFLSFQIGARTLSTIQIIVLRTIDWSNLWSRWVASFRVKWCHTAVCVEGMVAVSFQWLRRAAHRLVPPWFLLFCRAHDAGFSILIGNYGWSFDPTAHCDARGQSNILAFPLYSL